jgi:hypothetical protein
MALHFLENGEVGLGDSTFGDQMSHYDGSTTFSVTDVDLLVWCPSSNWHHGEALFVS